MTPQMRAAVDRLVADRERQGLSRYVTDPSALAAIAALLQDVIPARGKKAAAPSTSAAATEFSDVHPIADHQPAA